MNYIRLCCQRLEIEYSGTEIHGHFKRYCLPHGAGVRVIFKYIEEVKNMSIPKEVIDTMIKVFTNFLNLYKESEKEAVGMENLDEIYKLFHKSLFKWDNVVKVAEFAIFKSSESVEDYY